MRLKVHGVTIPKTDIKKILDVLNLESNIMMAYSRMAKSEALKWAKRSQDRAVALPDLYVEACMALRKSIHYYTKSGRFTTYAHSNIKRRMIAVCNRANSLSEMPAATIELRQLYDETKAEFNGPCTFQEVVEKMGISGQQVGTLRASLVLVFSQDALSPYHEDRDVSDFSTAGSSVFNGMDGDENWRVVARRGRSPLHPVFAPQEDVPVADLYTFLSQVILSTFEQRVLDGFFQDHQTGWQTRLAASMINPETEESYSRAAVSQAWGRIINKLQEVAGTND
jgi:DNA-directed RNA polymerase specialized sigma subunit